MNTIFHIGYPKTASRWFLEKFFPQIKNYTLIPPHEISQYFLRPYAFEFDKKEVYNQFSRANTPNMIFSNHGFIGTTHSFGLNGYLTKLHAERIKQVYPNAKIIITIRRQPEIIVSSYLQYIKGGGTNSTKQYLYHKDFRGINGFSQFAFQHFEYHHVLDYYQELFGKESVHVIVYEEFADNPRMVLEDLRDKFQFDVNLDDISFQRTNLSYRIGTRNLALIVNRFTRKKMINKYYFFHLPGLHGYSRILLKKLNTYKIFGPSIKPANVLGKSNLDYINQYYTKSNRILTEKFDLKQIEKYNYPV